MQIIGETTNMVNAQEGNWLETEMTWGKQLEAKKAHKCKEKMEGIESKVWTLKEEESFYLDRLKSDYSQKVSWVRKDAKHKESKMMELWIAKHL